jgi:hypothetical protein
MAGAAVLLGLGLRKQHIRQVEMELATSPTPA